MYRQPGGGAAADPLASDGHAGAWITPWQRLQQPKQARGVRATASGSQRRCDPES